MFCGLLIFFFFFFQAEDGIRDKLVTGVQTCALPIYMSDLEMVRLMMLNMDPPEHTKLRKIVNRGFTPKRIRDLTQILEQRAASVIDDVIEQGECDFITAVACELPLQAIADLLGVPQEDRHLVFDWSNRMIGFDDPDLRTSAEDGEIAAAELYGYAESLAAERLREPRDDIVTA